MPPAVGAGSAPRELRPAFPISRFFFAKNPVYVLFAFSYECITSSTFVIDRLLPLFCPRGRLENLSRIAYSEAKKPMPEVGRLELEELCVTFVVYSL
jgi:hypothetical protein